MCVCMCVRMSVYICMSVCACECIWVCGCVCACVYISICVYRKFLLFLCSCFYSVAAGCDLKNVETWCRLKSIVRSSVDYTSVFPAFVCLYLEWKVERPGEVFLDFPFFLPLLPLKSQNRDEYHSLSPINLDVHIIFFFLRFLRIQLWICEEKT